MRAAGPPVGTRTTPLLPRGSTGSRRDTLRPARRASKRTESVYRGPGWHPFCHGGLRDRETTRRDLRAARRCAREPDDRGLDDDLRSPRETGWGWRGSALPRSGPALRIGRSAGVPAGARISGHFIWWKRTYTATMRTIVKGRIAHRGCARFWLIQFNAVIAGRPSSSGAGSLTMRGKREQRSGRGAEHDERFARSPDADPHPAPLDRSGRATQMRARRTGEECARLSTTGSG